MALGDILARLLSVASFVLILVIIFAGSQCGGALDDVFIILLDVSRLKPAPGPDPEQGPVTDLGIYDFYTTHMLSYCAGYYDSQGNRNTTMCTTTAVPFAFDLDAVLSRDLATKNLSQSDLDWPAAVISDFAWVATTTKFMSVLAVLNIAVMGLATLLDGLMFSRADFNYPGITRFFTLASMVVTVILSSLGTFLAAGFVRLFNHHGDLYDISATGGSQFLVLTWVSFALCLLRNAPFLATVRICQRRDTSRNGDHEEESFRLLSSAEADLSKQLNP